jgi:hypothetical protein
MAMPSVQHAPALVNVCRPGDISITPTSTGYEIRRAAADGESATRWELVATVASAKAAGRSARELAERTGRSIWLYFGGAELIPLTETLARNEN